MHDVRLIRDVRDRKGALRRTVVVSASRSNVKGILRDHSSDSALNFHKIRDVCIFVMVLDVLT